MEEFRARYRETPDVLLVDDIQFLSNKDSSQDEFFHTFNALHHAHKQIVLTSDKLPGELPGVEDRLRSRFTWGLIAEVETPDLETRVAILKRKAEIERVTCPTTSRCTWPPTSRPTCASSRGALLRLAARASFHGQAISVELAREALAKLIATRPHRPHHRDDPAGGRRLLRRQAPGLKGPKRHRADRPPAHGGHVSRPEAHRR